jgi:repressor LexA
MLNERAREINSYIERYRREKGSAPTIREIGRQFEIASTNGVRYYLNLLEKAGYISRTSGISRGIGLSGVATAPSGIPILGRVAAGQPILAEENIEEYVPVPAFAGGGDGDYLLRIRGDSMKNAGIMEDDLVVVHQQDTAHQGDIVVALLGEEATVKRYFREPDHIRLQPENETMEPIRTREVKVLGRVVGLLRSM